MRRAAQESVAAHQLEIAPGGIIESLALRQPIYRPTAAYGHFGRSAETGIVGGKKVAFFGWEDTSLAEQLREAARRAA